MSLTRVLKDIDLNMARPDGDIESDSTPRFYCHDPKALGRLLRALIHVHAGIAPVCSGDDSVRRAQELIDDYGNYGKASMKLKDELPRFSKRAERVPDEPIFVIFASDITGPWAVRAWANHAEELATVGPEKIEGARRLARQMIAWQNKNGAKVPD